MDSINNNLPKPDILEKFYSKSKNLIIVGCGKELFNLKVMEVSL